METFVGIGVLVLLGVLVLWFILSRMRIVPQTHAMLISGSRNADGSKVVKPGGRAFIIPVLQSATLVPLGQVNVPLSVGGVDSNKIPVQISGVAMVKVKQDDNSIRDAQERFGSAEDFEREIAKNLQQVLIGSLRSAIASMTVEELLTKRETLAKNVRDATENEVAVMGIAVDSLQVLDIQDENGYIQALGARESQKVMAEARTAQAQYNREATDKEIESQQSIAERERDLEIRRAALQEETDRANAVAAAAGPLARAEQDREIARLRQETAEQEAILRERQLDIEIKKPADAKKYETEVNAAARASELKITAEANAEKTKIDAAAEAERVRIAAEAEANKVKTEADADATQVKLQAGAEAEKVRVSGEAEASSISAIAGAEASATQAKGFAEAEAMAKKADAYEKYGQAAVLELLIERAPEIARELASPMSNIDNLTVFSTDGASALPKAVASNFGQLDELFKGLTGTGLTDLVGNFSASKNEENSIPAKPALKAEKTSNAAVRAKNRFAEKNDEAN